MFTGAIIFILVGLLLLFNNQIQSWLINNLVDPSSEITIEEIHQNQQQDASFDFDAVEDLDFSTVVQAQMNRDDLPVIGWIAIPDVDLSISILNGVSNINLAAGAGTMKQDQQMGAGNYSLAGHNRAGGQLLFNPLHRAEIGMSIHLTDMEVVYTYEITSIEMVDPNRIDVIEDQGETMITLVTCNVDGSRRLIVQGRFLEQSLVDETSQEILSHFDT